MNEYSSLKMPWWYVRDGGLPDVPKQVQVVLSDLCNQDCGFCAYRMTGYTSNEMFVGDSPLAAYGHNNPKRWMPTDRALSLLEELKAAGVLAVQFTGGGEPLVHPDHRDIFRKARFLSLSCSLVTNGLLLRDSVIEELVYFSWVRISIDAGTPQTYARIRNASESSFKTVWSHVHKLAARLKEKSADCLLGIGYVVTPSNYAEIGTACRLASESGVKNIRLSAMFSPDDEKPYAKIYGDIKDVIAQAKQSYEREDFQIHDLFGDRVDDLKQHNPDYKTCSYQYYTSYIGADLRPYRCCVYSYSKRGNIAGADLKEQSFADFWKSDERKADFNAFDATKCERCQFNNKNKAMDYLMKERPTHVEFP